MRLVTARAHRPLSEQLHLSPQESRASLRRACGPSHANFTGGGAPSGDMARRRVSVPKNVTHSAGTRFLHVLNGGGGLAVKSQFTLTS